MLLLLYCADIEGCCCCCCCYWWWSILWVMSLSVMRWYYSLCHHVCAVMTLVHLVIFEVACVESLGSFIKCVRTKGGREVRQSVDKSGRGEGGFQHIRTSTAY